MQRQVDELGLHQCLTIRPSLADSLTACQINEIQLGTSHCVLTTLGKGRGGDNGKGGERVQGKGTSQGRKQGEGQVMRQCEQ